MIHGRNLIVALDGVAIAAAKTCSLDMDQSFLEACSPVSGRTHTKIPTTYNWGVSVDGLVADYSSPTVSLENKLIAGTKCLLTFTDGSGNRRAGYVYVRSCKESGSVGGFATYSASFESTGELGIYRTFDTVSELIPGYEGGFVIEPEIAGDYDRDYRIYAASFYFTAGKLMVAYNDVFIICEEKRATIKDAVEDNDWLFIDRVSIATGNDEEPVNINIRDGWYTILFNAYYLDTPNPGIIVLQNI